MSCTAKSSSACSLPMSRAGTLRPWQQTCRTAAAREARQKCCSCFFLSAGFQRLQSGNCDKAQMAALLRDILSMPQSFDQLFAIGSKASEAHGIVTKLKGKCPVKEDRTAATGHLVLLDHAARSPCLQVAPRGVQLLRPCVLKLLRVAFLSGQA